MVTPTTRIDASHRIDGSLHASEPVSLFGHLVGEVVSDDVFIVEASAIVEGDVQASEVVVLGTVVGVIEATESVTVGATGQVSGDIKTRSLELIAGGRIQGQVESAATVARAQVGRTQAAAWNQGARRTSSSTRGRDVSASTTRTTAASVEAPKPKRAAKKKSKPKATAKKARVARREEVELSPEVVELDSATEPATS
jgi:cytoskeletal protein CcmA (bactofilin family)